MPYKDLDKRRECVRAAVRKYRASDHCKPRPKRLGIEARSQTARYVAIDAEGWDLGPPQKFSVYDPVYERMSRQVARPHRVFLFGACAEDGEPEFLNCAPGKNHLSSLEILNWLIDLPSHFPGAQFIMFSARYDWVHAIKDVDPSIAVKIQKAQFAKGLTFAPAVAFMLGRDRYAVRMVCGKSFSLMKLGTIAEARAARSRWNGEGWPWVKRILIHDTFSTWNSGLLEAASKMDGAFGSDDERRILEKGKEQDRLHFVPGEEALARRYQEVELRVLCRMTRLTYRDACSALGLKVKRPEGVGPIAGAMLRKWGIKEHCLKVSSGADDTPIPQWQLLAERAFSGGRIDLLYQGYSDEPVWEYDRRSAYPAEMAELISQAGGRFKTWTFKYDATDRRTVRKRMRLLTDCSPLSMVRLHAWHDGYCHPLPPVYFEDAYRASIPPFYPFFYRTAEGRIYYPPVVRGVYMVEELRFAGRWAEALGLLDGYHIQVEELYEFIPGAGDVKPFAAMMEQYYADKEHYKGSGSVLGLTTKNGMCATYGKLAQSRSRAAALANPLYAAQITAGMRVKLGDAALQDPRNIVSFATDAVVSMRPLDLDCSNRLGAWECKSPASGDVPSMFVIPGQYEIADRVSRTRGFKVDRDEFRALFADIRDNWRRGARRGVSFPIDYLMTLGLATAAPRNWKYAGYWMQGQRELNCHLAGVKREYTLNKARADRLVPVPPKALLLNQQPWRMELSAPIVPDWQDDDATCDALSEIEAAYYAAVYR